MAVGLKFRTKFVWIGSLLGLALLAGCGQSGPVKYPVAGTVKFESGPLPQGHITLMPIEGGGAPDARPITNGKYSFLASPGKKRVEITATREKAGSFDQSMGAAPREEAIGPEFNVESK